MKNKINSNLGIFVRNVGRFTLVQTLILVLMSTSAHAGILVRPPQTPEARLQVYLQKQRSNNQSFVEFWRSQNPTGEKIIELQNVFEAAQRLLLAEGPNAAKTKFLEVSDFAFKADWKETEREIIFQSLMRLASFEKDPSSRAKLFEKAASFDLDRKPDSEIFEPNFVSEFSQYKKSVLTRLIVWRPKIDQDIEIYLNGKRIHQNQRILLSPGLKRITFVSNSNLPHTMLVEPAKIDQTPVTLQPIVTGECGHLNWHYPAEDRTRFVALLENDCIERGDGTRGGLFEKIERPAPSRTAISFPAETSSESILKKPLFWVVTGALVTAAVLVIQNNKPSGQSPTPTHAEGL